MRFLSPEGHEELMIQAVGLALVGIPFCDKLLLLVDDRLEVVGQLGVSFLEPLQMADEIGTFASPLKLLLVASCIFAGHRLHSGFVAGLCFAQKLHVALELVEPLPQGLYLGAQLQVLFARLVEKGGQTGVLAEGSASAHAQQFAVAFEGGVAQLQGLRHQLVLVAFHAELFQLLSQDPQGLYFTLQLPVNSGRLQGWCSLVT